MTMVKRYISLTGASFPDVKNLRNQHIIMVTNHTLLDQITLFKKLIEDVDTILRLVRSEDESGKLHF